MVIGFAAIGGHNISQRAFIVLFGFLGPLALLIVKINAIFIDLTLPCGIACDEGIFLHNGLVLQRFAGIKGPVSNVGIFIRLIAILLTVPVIDNGVFFLTKVVHVKAQTVGMILLALILIVGIVAVDQPNHLLGTQAVDVLDNGQVGFGFAVVIREGDGINGIICTIKRGVTCFKRHIYGF